MISHNVYKNLPITDSDIQAYYNTSETTESLKAASQDGSSNTPSDFCAVSAISQNSEVVYNPFEVNIDFAGLMYGYASPVGGGKSELRAKISQLEYKTLAAGSIDAKTFELFYWYFKRMAKEAVDATEYRRGKLVNLIGEVKKRLKLKEVRKGGNLKSKEGFKLLGQLKKNIHAPVSYKLDTPKDMPCGMRVTHCVEGACGSRIYYNIKESREGKSYECYIYLTQSLLDSWNHATTGNFIWNIQKLFINEGNLKCSRIDTRIDDRFKNWLQPHEITKSILAGNYKGFNNREVITNYKDSWTQYLGSKKSESFVRIYETKEKHGEYGIRWERQFRGKKAAAIHWELATKFKECFNHLPVGRDSDMMIDIRKSENAQKMVVYLRHIANLSIGNISFSDKWFLDLEHHCQHERISFAILKEPQCLRKRGEWINKNWKNTLAILFQGLGVEKFWEMIQAWVDKGLGSFESLSKERQREFTMFVAELQSVGEYALGFSPTGEFVG